LTSAAHPRTVTVLGRFLPELGPSGHAPGALFVPGAIFFSKEN